MINITYEISENGCGYRHYEHSPSKFVNITITENIAKKEFECSIHPNTDKGYRDPFAIKTFDSLEKAKQFTLNYLIDKNKEL